MVAPGIYQAAAYARVCSPIPTVHGAGEVMHVVILAEFAVASGGAEKVAVESARGLAEAGVDVTFLQAIDGPADTLLDHPRIARVSLGLDDIWTQPAWRGAITGIWHAEAARRLAVALDALTLPPDCIHLHQWTRALSPAVMPVLLDRGVPVALTLHDYFLACPNGLYYRFDLAELCTLEPMSLACAGAGCDPQSRLHKAVRFSRAAAMRGVLKRKTIDVVHVSDASRARIGEMLSGLSLRHHRIDNPVRTPRAEPADPASGDAIVYVGRLTKEKGADLVADAARLAGMPVLFIGKGPLEDTLRERPGVEVLGWKSPDETAAIVRRRARAVCAPSRWYETGPLTVYEALAQGIPVLASDRSGSAEKVVDGVTGFVVEPEADVLAKAMLRLADDALVREMGLDAHDRYWSAPLSLAAHAKALIGAYERMVRQSGVSSPIGGSVPADTVFAAE